MSKYESIMGTDWKPPNDYKKKYDLQITVYDFPKMNACQK